MESDESSLSMAQERTASMVESGLLAVRRAVSVGPSRSLQRQRECSVCGEDIPLARIEVAPWATRCFDCQSAAERK